jgi:hypothetical protein
MSIPPFSLAMNVNCLTFVAVSLYHIINMMCHMSLRLVCIIADLCGQSLLCETKSSNKGQILERSFVVKVRCTRQSPPMRGRFLRYFVVEVRCARQSPPTRGRSLRPFMVKVCCVRKSPLTWGKSWKPIVDKVRCARLSPPLRGRFLRSALSKSAARNKVLH